MAKQRNKFSLDTTYKNLDMRSRLEARTAFLLDQLNITWEYEPDQHLLSNGELYIPDFYLPEHNQFIECKGDIKDPSLNKPKLLSEDTGVEAIILSQKKGIFLLHFVKEQSIGESNQIHIVECSKCEEYSLVPDIGSWKCRKCGNHAGDHDIEKYSIFRGEWADSIPELEITDCEKIQEFSESLKGE